MGLELSIGNELAQLKLSLGEFTTVIKYLIGEAKQQEVREALKEMIQEVRKSYDVAVDVFTPLYALDTKRKFTSRFSQERANFKSTYLKAGSRVRTHCGIVARQLEELKKRKAWMKSLPYIRRSFKRLEDLAESWIANDTWLALNMESLLRGMNGFLNTVSRMQKKNASEAFRYLTSSLDQFEDDFLAINKWIDELTDISKQL
jgi:hypothetical protein